MFRKTVLTTAIIGAGLGSMTGAAFAGDDPGDGGHGGHEGHHSSWSHGHGKSESCSNDVKAENLTKGGGLADVLGGDQILAPINACHILDDNSLLNDNNVALLGGSIHNGDTDGASNPLGGLGL
jgi:hypothetical protein